MTGPRHLWGIDLTRVLLLGLFPVWILGIIDYHGSRLIALERVSRPTSAEVLRVLEYAFREYGPPARLLSDRGMVFRSFKFEASLALHQVDHVLTKPRHPWTNGRIERLSRTFKETSFRHVWLLHSLAQIDRYCRDFFQLYNRDRPHSAFGGRTPDEVFFGKLRPRCTPTRITYFDGHLCWYTFG